MSTDSALKQLVLDQLRWEPGLDAAHIGVVSVDGAIRLSGHVKTYPEKALANDVTRQVRGVKAIADDIEVVPAGKRGDDDASIAERIAHVLNWNVSIPDDTVKATVRDGVVTLSGEVDWQKQRDQIAKQVHHVSGVKRIENSISIKPRATPNNVQEDIEKALARFAAQEVEKVKVSVAGSTVTLEGTVKSLHERDLVEQAAWKSAGVTKVIDHLTVDW